MQPVPMKAAEARVQRIAIGNMIFGLVALTMAWTVTGSAGAQGWEPASGDEKNAAQGCAAMPGDDYVCTFLRCDAKGSLNFYAAAPGPDIAGNVVMDIDGQRFPMIFRSPGSPHLAYTNKADALPPGLLAALKTGKVMKIRGAGLKAGYDTIPLRNADREIGRLETTCGIVAAAAPAPAGTTAQAPAPVAAEQPRPGAAEGAAFCKANLASAPAGLTLGEVEAFCSCMGVQESAMFKGDMTDAAKASLRPQLQQMCVAIVRNQAQAPGQVAAPAVPSATLPAPPVVAQPAPAQAPAPMPVEKHRALTIASNRSGAPIAYVRAIPSQEMVEGGETPPAPRVEALLLYCRAKDNIGARVLFKPGVRASVVSIGSAGHSDDLKLDQNGVVTNLDRWASFVKKSEFFERKPDIASGPLYVELDLPRKGSRNSMASDPGGSVSLAGLTAARARMRALCSEAIAKGAPAGNYDTTGIEGFPEEALVIPAPGQASAVAPQLKTAAPAPGEAECRALLKRTGDAMMPKMQQLVPVLNNVSSPAQFCKAARLTVAFHGEVKQRIAACSAHGFVKKLIGESNTAINTARAQMRQVGC